MPDKDSHSDTHTDSGSDSRYEAHSQIDTTASAGIKDAGVGIKDTGEAQPCTDQYSDIRPYTDAEVTAVLERLGQSQSLHQALVGYRYPRLPGWMKGLSSRVLGWQLRRHFAPVTTVAAFQDWLGQWVHHLVTSTTAQLEIHGLEHLTKGYPYLWLSNHRDIAMDPTLVNYALMTQAWPTAHIAIGDNLLQNPILADLMRLNKSFIVKRSAANKREKLRELQRLSAYIRDSMASGHSVWLAQREGRSKDNLDHTDTAVLKMLALSGREEALDFTQSLSRLSPVPVLIQYEWDPCDRLKARELVARERDGQYVKAAGEDTQSMMLGLKGHKGRVRLCFGRPLDGAELASAASMAAATDHQLQSMKQVLPSHQAAVWLLKHEFGVELDEVGITAADQLAPDQLPIAAMRARYQGESPEVARRLLTTYAASILGSNAI